MEHKKPTAFLNTTKQTGSSTTNFSQVWQQTVSCSAELTVGYCSLQSGSLPTVAAYSASLLEELVPSAGDIVSTLLPVWEQVEEKAMTDRFTRGEHGWEQVFFFHDSSFTSPPSFLCLLYPAGVGGFPNPPGSFVSSSPSLPLRSLAMREVAGRYVPRLFVVVRPKEFRTLRPIVSHSNKQLSWFLRC